jgi:polar amino acid transport system substrate-binding protein
MDFEANPKILKNKVKNQKATQYQSFNEALIDLQNDRIDGLLIDRVYANYYLQTEGILKDYNVFPVGFETESFAVGVCKADKTLKKKIDEAFVKLYQKGQFQKISKKWFGTDVATDDIK